MNYVIYVADVETTGLDSRINDIIELSLYRLTDDVQKTWCIRPFNYGGIDPNSLRINGHKLENITHVTKEGRETYLEPAKALIDIENWINEDCSPTENRVLCGQNVAFDKEHLEQLWTKTGVRDSFPFGRRTMDTMHIEFFMDWCKGTMAEGYSLNNLVKKYGVKNEKAHSAAADTKATKEVFEKQVDIFKQVLISFANKV